MVGATIFCKNALPEKYIAIRIKLSRPGNTIWDSKRCPRAHFANIDDCIFSESVCKDQGES
jgi:hypothetical protein